MEYNKEHAFRIKEMSEKKFIERDLAGAKQLAIMAQNLYPGLDGLSQLLATLDVYISAEKRRNGEIDWYGILGIEPPADDDTVWKHYRKLAIILHPDNNKAVGAEGAFKIISEAWGFLSNAARKSTYDQKLNLSDNQKVSNYKSGMLTGQNGINHFFNSNRSILSTQKNVIHPKCAPPSQFSKPGTFWTICNFCKTQFQYLINYLNQNLLCQNCRKPFYAVEVPPPPIDCNDPPTALPSYLRGKNSVQCTRIEKSFATGKKPVSMANVGLVAHSGAFVKPGSLRSIQSTEPKPFIGDESLQMRTNTSIEPGACLTSGPLRAGLVCIPKDPGMLKKKRRNDDYRMNCTANQMASRNGGISESGTQRGGFETRKMSISESHKFNQTRELSQLELRNMLMEKAKKDICLKLKDCRIQSALSKISAKEMEKKERGTEKAPSNGMKSDLIKCSGETYPKDDLDTKHSDAVSMIVPDPDFHDFDMDRTEKSFGDNQVWAAYDDDDGMPRYYAMIHNVISRKPLRMRISWLNSKSNRELAPLNWIGSGFLKTNGDFWIGKHEVNKSLNSFSHKVKKWAKGIRGTIQIYPKKGDVWALYRNWSPDWNELTPDEVIHKYAMVEVLEDYDEERGVTVAPLIKVAGFKTVFHRHSDFSKTKTITKQELFRLSHQVPSYFLTGQEGRNAPKDCWELDPASLPIELLKILTEAEVTETAENPLGGFEKSQKIQSTEDEKNTNGKGNATEMRKNKGKEAMGEQLLVYKRKRGRINNIET